MKKVNPSEASCMQSLDVCRKVLGLWNASLPAAQTSRTDQPQANTARADIDVQRFAFHR